jgi:hypothetical protein
MRERAQGVEEGHVFSMREHHLVGFGVPFEELAQRPLTSLIYLVRIVYRSYLEMTSVVVTSYFLITQRRATRLL